MARRYYKVAEIEALIPVLERTFTRILQLRVGLRTFEQKLETAGVGVDVDDENVEVEPEPETPEVRTARAMFRGYYQAMSEGLEEIRALGGDVKDLDIGLVDFPGRRGDEEILLCWRLGEKKIEFWHTVEGGFAGRRPLDEGMTRATSRLD